MCRQTNGCIVFTTSGREKMADKIRENPQIRYNTFKFNNLNQSTTNILDTNKECSHLWPPHTAHTLKFTMLTI